MAVVVYLPYVANRSHQPHRACALPQRWLKRLDPSDPGRSAGILGLGNVASRVVGLARESVISFYFGSSGELSAFNLASRVPAMLYDLLVGGMLSAALVPVFSDYARPERRAELARLASAMLSLIAVVMGAIVILLELFAVSSPISWGFQDPALQLVLQRCLLIASVLLFGLSGGVTGLLYAMKRFSITALSGAVFNLGIGRTLLANRHWCTPCPSACWAASCAAVMSHPACATWPATFPAWNHPGSGILQLYVPIARPDRHADPDHRRAMGFSQAPSVS
jgi:peptidoglycan biosynthesis protein MviN/MurJ (putative lipid II flippase)